MSSFSLRTRLTHADPCLAQLVMGSDVKLDVTYTPFGILIQVLEEKSRSEQRQFCLPFGNTDKLPADFHLMLSCLHPGVVRNIIVKSRKAFRGIDSNWGEAWLRFCKRLPFSKNQEVSPAPPSVY